MVEKETADLCEHLEGAVVGKEIIEVKTVCPICRKLDIVDVVLEEFIKWRDGEMIQNAMPNLSLHEREKLITGICEECWQTEVC